jgi:signal peptidase I, archaeal type
MFKKICNILSGIILIVMALIAGTLLIPHIFGYQTLAVLSGSMEPTYRVGSIVFVKSVAPESVRPGDAITFRLSGDTVATHRVVKVDFAKKQFITKGDANNTEDGPTDYSSLVGRASKFSVPLLGYLSVYIKTRQGILAATAVAVVVILLTFLPDIFTKDTGEAQAT